MISVRLDTMEVLNISVFLVSTMIVINVPLMALALSAVIALTIVFSILPQIDAMQ